MDARKYFLRLRERRLHGVDPQERPVHKTVGQNQQSVHCAKVSVLPETDACIRAE
jgi:hypothetical protein